ncbi:MAG: FAD-binding protein, partial [Turicibacter sp.]
ITKDSSGNVTGVTATKEDGGILTVKADAVIIATGGYGADTDRVVENLHSDLLYSLGVANKGEGIDLAIEAGGMPWDSSTALLHAAQLAGSETASAGYSSNSLTQLLMSPLLWVDASGSRIGNEDAIYDTVFWSNIAYSANGRYYIVVDEATLEDYTNGTSIKISNAGPGASLDSADFVALAEEAIAGGTAFKGSTLEELATQTGMQVDELEETITRYNTMIENGKDTDYGKSADSLLYKVESGNYYAFEARAVYLGTVGGVKVNEKLEVIDVDYNAIPGLYVVGSSAGGYYSNGSYPPYEGLALGFAYNSGRIAGENAAKYITK